MPGFVSVDVQDPTGNAAHVKGGAAGNLFVSSPLQDVTLATLAAAGTSTVNGADQSNLGAKGIKLVIDITVITGTGPTLTVTLQGKDVASGKYYTILASAALGAAATTVLTVFPGATASANVAANDTLPNIWRISYTVAGTTPAVTATIGASLV